jgi:hypothetical protein
LRDSPAKSKRNFRAHKADDLQRNFRKQTANKRMASPLTGAEQRTTSATVAEQTQGDAVQCYCGSQAARECVKKYGPTQGQYFWTCATPWRAAGRCSFFRWVDEREGKRLSYKGRRVATRKRFRIESTALASHN